MKPIDQNTARFFGRVAMDLSFDGMADNEVEGARLVEALGEFDIIMMGNHGVSVIGESVAEAFEMLYFLERSARTMVMAYSTGQRLNVMAPNLAQMTARGWDAYRGMAVELFEHLKRSLEKVDRSFLE